MILTAGRELDALVAESVLGWTWQTFDGEERFLTPAKPNQARRRAAGAESRFLENLPRFSTDIAAAWEVVEKMAKIHHCVSVECKNPGDNQWRIFAIGFNKPGFLLHATAAEAAERVCLAALKAVGA